MPKLWGQAYTRLDLLRRVGDIGQLAAIQPFELSDGHERGVRCLRMRNAAGLDLTLIADRGLGVHDLCFRGVPISFMTSVGVAHPSHADPAGLGWLRTWPAGFLTPCGLTQVGSPCNDHGEELGLHGRLSNLSARNVAWEAEWQDDDYLLWAEGALRETSAMGHNLLLKRRIWTKIDEPRFWINDRVENQGFSPTPLMFLHHINVGFPLVDAATRLDLPPHTTEPRDHVAQPGLDQCCEFSQPVAGYQEQVFYHDLQADPTGSVEVRLINPAWSHSQGLGLALRYSKAEFPVFVQWKMMREGFYVVGLEPANCHVEGRCAERERGTLQTLEPHEARTFDIEVAFSTTNEAS